MVGRKRTFQSTNTFGEIVSNALAETGTTQTKLAAETCRSVGYVNQTVTGRLAPSAEWTKTVASALGMTEEDKENLLQAAADANLERLGFTSLKKSDK